MRRKLAAVLAADIVGYSKLMSDNESATLAALREFRANSFALTQHSIVAKSKRVWGTGGSFPLQAHRTR